MVSSVFHAESRVMPQLVARLRMSRFRLCYQDARFCYDLTSGGDVASSHGKRRLIRGEGFATRISSNVRPQDPGGGATTIAAPRRMMDIDVSDTPELSGGTSVGPLTDFGGVGRGGHSWGTPRLGCPCDEQSERQPARVTVSDNSLGLTCVGGTLSHS